MTNSYKTLQQIKEAPGMYLGRPSVSDLFMFLVGYEFARTEIGAVGMLHATSLPTFDKINSPTGS